MTVPGPLELIRADVDEALRAFVDRRRPSVAGPDLRPLLDSANTLLSGGKRLRPAFCYWGWRGAGGEHRPEIVVAAAALELLQGSALVHDDVMDASDTRRGMPSAHRGFESLHTQSGWEGAADRFGVGAAIILGDLLLVWADEMWQSSGLSAQALAAGRPVYDLMRTELMCGQYLDLLEQARGRATFESAYRVALYKSGKYSVERPLHLGLAMAGGDPAWVERLCAEYGQRLGVAFQLRDDILGVYGDPAETGKPAGDDLREGKRTMLVTRTLESATPAQREVVRRLLGDPGLDDDGVAELRQIIVESGALLDCEGMIKQYGDEAVTALAQAPLTAESREALTALAEAAITRRA
ncbi:polyprenyl synthetase family protein [Rhizohabitans arisaemae]|uniref:polyprenyl synthetase family protein n=1 Tax=Rhizohabitans arisaemae TaxID=2720610 RepID=UPI0024B0587E|nr:polyprenyl synthetase family protein [Rhizohabitans arisaemae]